jgi:hypothetical protein
METYEDEKGPEKIQVLILSAGCELIRITASCWHVEKPTIETIALWRRVRHGPQELLFQDRGRKLGLFPTDSAVFAQPEGERFEILKKREILLFFHRPSVCRNIPGTSEFFTRRSPTHLDPDGVQPSHH